MPLVPYPANDEWPLAARRRGQRHVATGGDHMPAAHRVLRLWQRAKQESHVRIRPRRRTHLDALARVRATAWRPARSERRSFDPSIVLAAWLRASRGA